MDKSFLLFISVGLGFIYLISQYVGDIQEEDKYFQNNDYIQKHQYDAYQSVDSIGRTILNVMDVDEQTQIAVWNESSLKREFLELYPDFSLMKDFVKNRVNGEPLKSKLLKLVDDTETKFFSGSLSTEEAKYKLKSFK